MSCFFALSRLKLLLPPAVGSTRMRLPASASVMGFCALLVSAGCDFSPRPARDASTQSQRLAEVAIRLDAPSDGPPSATVLAYRAGISGVAVDDVLSVIDPLVAPAPESGCVLRDVAGAARAIGAHGGKLELEPLGGLVVDLGAGEPYLRPLPRVYPDLASAVSGVVGEAGPVDLAVAPQTLGLTDESQGRRLAVAVPTLPRLLDADAAPLPANPILSSRGDLVLLVNGPLQTFVELRPFGATWALACATVGPARDRVVVPAAELGRLADLHVPVSLEAVARESQSLVLAGAPVRLTLEVRTSSVVELRP
jgi:hypothetical protein